MFRMLVAMGPCRTISSTGRARTPKFWTMSFRLFSALRSVMPILLSEVLKHPTLTAADPVIRAGAAAAAGTQLRWVHSSEVLDIAPLLSGGELLLTGGDAWVAASDA